jgi:hypothetical protein
MLFSGMISGGGFAFTTLRASPFGFLPLYIGATLWQYSGNIRRTESGVGSIPRRTEQVGGRDEMTIYRCIDWKFGLVSVAGEIPRLLSEF